MDNLIFFVCNLIVSALLFFLMRKVTRENRELTLENFKLKKALMFLITNSAEYKVILARLERERSTMGKEAKDD